MAHVQDKLWTASPHRTMVLRSKRGLYPCLYMINRLSNLLTLTFLEFDGSHHSPLMALSYELFHVTSCHVFEGLLLFCSNSRLENCLIYGQPQVTTYTYT